MDRAFAIAPTASCSYRYTDRAGYTTAPELAPPIGRTVDRDSSTFGVQTYDYGQVETSEEVGWDAYKRVVDGICEMLHRTGLFHGYSYNTWSDVVQYTPEFIQNWLASPQTSMYYSLQVMQNTQAKDDALAALDGNFGEMFGLMKSMTMRRSSQHLQRPCSLCWLRRVNHLFIPMKAATPYIHLHERKRTLDSGSSICWHSARRRRRSRATRTGSPLPRDSSW